MAPTDAPPAITALVTGATGMQGGGVARGLGRAGITVSALVRDPEGAAARSLAQEGIELVVGDLDDPAALAAACTGRTAVFSVQVTGSPSDPDREKRHADSLIRATRDAGVHHFVHSSVSATGWRALHPDVDAGQSSSYWDDKEHVEAAVRGAGFPTWTIVKPAFFMDNFVPPKSLGMFTLLPVGELLVASAETTLISLVSSEEFGDLVAQIIAEPARFSGAEIELGSEALTFTQIARIIADVIGRPVSATHLPAEEVDARLGRASWSDMQSWFDAVGYPARPEHAAAEGLEISTTFRSWAEGHREQLVAAVTG